MKKKSSTKDLMLSSNERLFLKNKSIFAPLNYSYFKPKGLKIYTFQKSKQSYHNMRSVFLFLSPFLVKKWLDHKNISEVCILLRTVNRT